MEGYSRRSFKARMRNGHEAEHDVYERGAGPAVVLIQELPGIGQETLRLAESLIGAGYRVVLPHLFGPLGRIATAGNVVRVLCLRREFRLFARNESSPIVDWLRALCRDVKSAASARGVGVIGMCLTGNFAITLMGDDSVLAAVAAQPSLGCTPGGLHMDDAEARATCERIDALGLGPMLAFRFERDRICPPEKFLALDAVFNQGARRIELHTLPGEGHAVLTRDFLDGQGRPRSDALARVIAYFDRCLKPA
jgi:dienelactone hydrolase